MLPPGPNRWPDLGTTWAAWEWLRSRRRGETDAPEQDKGLGWRILGCLIPLAIVLAVVGAVFLFAYLFGGH